ncbi:MAG: hypothetical protein ABW159_00585 [Candidatus Thiodiazotropha sp.]
MATDKKTIGITRDNNEVLQRLVIDGQFGSELDAAKFAMARAIKKGTEPGRIDSADTKWNVGSVDVDGKLRSLLTAFYPDVEEPFRLMEYLMNKGLSELAMSSTQKLDVYGIMFDE